MIQLSAHARILVATAPVDFLRGIDGLAALCRLVLHEDPLSGTCFVFRSRSGTALRVLAYDGQGFWLCTKRLSIARFRHWPVRPDKASLDLMSYELAVLLTGGDPLHAKGIPPWRPVGPSCSAGI